MVYNTTILYFLIHYDVKSRDHVTSQKNGTGKYFHFGKNGYPATCVVQKQKNLREVYFFNLKPLFQSTVKTKVAEYFVNELNTNLKNTLTL